MSPPIAPAIPAIAGAIKDTFGGRLGGLAAVCFFLSVAATVTAAWAAFRYVLPLLPEGEGWMQYLWNVAEWLSGAGVVILAIVLAPTLSMIVGSLLFDIAAARIESDVNLSPGRMVSVGEGLANGLRIAWLPLVLNIATLPLLFIPVVNIVWFVTINGYLMGREYFSLAAVRRMPFDEARRLRARHRISVFLVGLGCSFIPFVAPLVGASAMTRLVKSFGGDDGGPDAVQ